MFTIFQSTSDPKLQLYYTEVAKARQFLSNQVKKAAQMLYQAHYEGKTITALSLFVRAFGMNMHLLGELRSALCNIAARSALEILAKEAAKSIVLAEIVSRTLKQLLRARFRRLLCPIQHASTATTFHQRTAVGSDFKDALLSFLNIAFSPSGSFRTKFTKPPLGHAAEWNAAAAGTSLKNAIHLRFKHGLEQSELSEQFDIFKDGLRGVGKLTHEKLIRKVITRLEIQLGLILSTEARESLIRLDPFLSWPFDTRHVEKLAPTIKSISAVLFLEGRRLVTLAKAEIRSYKTHAFHPSKVRWFGQSPFLSKSNRRTRSPTPGVHRTKAYRHFGFAVGDTPTQAGIYLSKAIAVLTQAVSVKATDPSRRLALAEALFLRGRSWCDLEDLKLAAEHVDVILILPGGTSQEFYRTCTILTDLLFCLDQLSYRLIRKLTSISSQQTMGRRPEEVFAIADYVQTLRQVSLSAYRSNDKDLRRMSKLVNTSILSFRTRIQWASLICCCPESGCLGKRGFAHPIDGLCLLNIMCSIGWIIFSFLSEVNNDNVETIVLVLQIFSATFGIFFVALLLRKLTKRWKRTRRLLMLCVLFVFALLFVAHVVVQIMFQRDSPQRLKLAPIATLALFFTNILPTLLMLSMWVMKFYFQYSNGNPFSITSYNPYDFLERSNIFQEMVAESPAVMDHDRKETLRRSVEADREVDAGEKTKLRQSSAFGKMSRFGSMENCDLIIEQFDSRPLLTHSREHV